MVIATIQLPTTRTPIPTQRTAGSRDTQNATFTTQSTKLTQVAARIFAVAPAGVVDPRCRQSDGSERGEDGGRSLDAQRSLLAEP